MMRLFSRDVIGLLSQFRVIFQITTLERFDILDRQRSWRGLRRSNYVT